MCALCKNLLLLFNASMSHAEFKVKVFHALLSWKNVSLLVMSSSSLRYDIESKLTIEKLASISV